MTVTKSPSSLARCSAESEDEILPKNEEEIVRLRRDNVDLLQKCQELRNSVWTLEQALMQSNVSATPSSSQEDVNEWQEALQKTLIERQQLLMLLKRYQKLAEVWRQEDPTRFVRVVDVAFRCRAGSSEECYYGKTSLAEIDKDEMRMPIQEGRRSSGSSSILYAGVTAKEPVDVAIETETAHDGSRAQRSVSMLRCWQLERLMQGLWMYKYPRRRQTKLLREELVPMDDLSCRLFLFQPWSSTILWASEKSTKLVTIQGYLVEEKRWGKQSETVKIVIFKTDQQMPLVLLPRTRDDYEVLISGLHLLTNIPTHRLSLMIQSEEGLTVNNT